MWVIAMYKIELVQPYGEFGLVLGVETVDFSGDPNRVAQDLFWAYKQAKSNWRKFMAKATEL